MVTSTFVILFSSAALARAGGAGFSGSPFLWLYELFFAVITFPLFILFVWWIHSGLDKKIEQTEKLMSQLAQKDPIWNPEELRSYVKEQFFKIQKAWCHKDLDKLKIFLTPTFFTEWRSKIEVLSQNGDTNVMEFLDAYLIRFVLVQNFKMDQKDSFTVCIDASAKDYFINKDGESVHSRHRAVFFKGRSFDIKVVNFREFWTFIRKDNQWLLCRIDQSRSWRKIIKTVLIDEDRTGPV